MVAALVLLGGCSNDGLDDLRQFVNSAHQDRKPKVEPVPEPKVYEPFAYAAEKLPDPFAPGNLKPLLAQKATGPRPDLNRRKEPLEEYPLDSLKMVGTVEQGTKTWAVIQAPDGTVYRARNGMHMGQNFGTIVKITDDKVDLVELVPDPMGRWIERPASIALAQ